MIKNSIEPYLRRYVDARGFTQQRLALANLVDLSMMRQNYVNYCFSKSLTNPFGAWLQIMSFYADCATDFLLASQEIFCYNLKNERAKVKELEEKLNDRRF